MPDTLAQLHTRDHGSLLASCEKRALIWLAERIPSWVTSDYVTGLALVAMLGADPSGLAMHAPTSHAGVTTSRVPGWPPDPAARGHCRRPTAIAPRVEATSVLQVEHPPPRRHSDQHWCLWSGTPAPR